MLNFKFQLDISYLKNITALFTILFFTVYVALGQSPDSTKQKDNQTIDVPSKPHSPKKATIMSAIVPGLGQAYNKKYWKIPIIYGGIGTLSYFLSNDFELYNFYKDQYQNSNFTDNAAFSNIEISRKNIEVKIVLISVLYILNVLDANVDAHLRDFDVSDDLSLNVSPNLFFVNNKSHPGISFTLKL